MSVIIKETTIFSDWLKGLKDLSSRAKIIARIESAKRGNFGDCKPVGEGVSEMRIHGRTGYRVYFIRSGLTVYILLVGGEKSTQKKDIKRAIELAREIKGEEK